MILAVLLPSCSNKTQNLVKADSKEVVDHDIPKEVAEKVFDKAEITKDGEPTMKPEDCHGVRKTIQFLEDEVGVMMLVGNDYVISKDNGSKRWKPCKIPGKMKVEGMKVQFTGEVLEIFPNERLSATPFRLKSMRETD